MRVGDVEFEISGIGSMSFDCKFDGFGVPCGRCGAENACNRLSGNLPPCLPPGYYCDPCHKIVCKKASRYYDQRFKESTRNLKTTVLFRKDGWHGEEVQRLVSGIKGGIVWTSQEHTEYLVIEGHHAKRTITKCLSGVPAYTVRQVTGTDGRRIPFLPFN